MNNEIINELPASEYQEFCKTTAVYEHDFYPAASLMVEAAELADLFVKPQLRGDDKAIQRHEIVSEAGDVMWNLCAILTANDITLHEVMNYNIQKLLSRKKRGMLKGDGGDR